MHEKIRRLSEIAAVICAAAFLFLQASQEQIPAWVHFSDEALTISDTTNLDTLTLTGRTVYGSYQGQTIWHSRTIDQIQQMLWCDIDQDGQNELLLLSWKIGRFGKARPFWVSKDETGYSQHIYVYEWDAEKKRMDPAWMASDIGIDAVTLSFQKERHLLIARDQNGEISTWRWNDWGLEKEDCSVTLLAAGDNLIHRPIYRLGLKRGNFDFLYQHIRSTIEAADLSVLNQETPLVTKPSLYGDFPLFGTPVEVADAVAHAGFDVVTLATNHALDRSMTGIDTSIRAFEDLGITVLGVQSSRQQTKSIPYQLITRKGIRFALLNYTQSLNGQPLPDDAPYAVHRLKDPGQIRQDLALARQESDLTIVFVHWGSEYSDQIDAQQQEWTRFFLEQGVDVVIGTHPHVVQPCKMLTDDNGHEMLVFYSLGNFMSAQDRLECVQGELAQITFAPDENGYHIESYETLPIITHQQRDFYSVFLRKDYPDILARRHRLGVIPK